MKSFWDKHWVGVIAILGGACATYFQLTYVLDKVNPDTIAQYQVEKARLDERRSIRWCIGKAAIRRQTAEQALECAD